MLAACILIYEQTMASVEAYIDFSEEENIEEELDHPCAKKVWDKIKESKVVHSLLKSFLGENPVADSS